MEMIKERLKELEVEKTDILNKYPEEDEANQSVYAMAIVRILMEVKFLNKLNASLKEKEKKNKEYVLCSSNWYDDGVKHIHQPTNIKVGYITSGQRHHNCIATFAQIVGFPYDKKALKIMETVVEGFLTSKNRFVGRKEAMKIVSGTWQLDGRKVVEGKLDLYSEDLY